METKYTVYKVTNKVNNKIYIGVHKTLKPYDSYMGSGKHISRAVKKYGIENFEKEVLFVYDNPEEAYEKEAELVDKDFILREDTYNIQPGGKGGIGKPISDEQKIKLRSRALGRKLSEETKKKIGSYHTGKSVSEKTRNKISSYRKNTEFKNQPFTGKTHSEEAKEKMRLANLGKNIGTMWINNGVKNKRIQKTDAIPKGWNSGLLRKEKSI